MIQAIIKNRNLIMFLISLTKGANRKFITIPEDDIIDLPHESGILTKVTKTIKDAVAAL